MAELLVSGVYVTAIVSMASAGGLVSPTLGSAPNLTGRYVMHREVCYEITDHTLNEISIVGTWQQVPQADDVVQVSWKFSDLAGQTGLALSDNHHHATLSANLRVSGFLGDATMKYLLFDNCKFFVHGDQAVLALGSAFWKSTHPKTAGVTVVHFQGGTNAFYGRDPYRDPTRCPVADGGTLSLCGVELRATPDSATQRSDFDLAENSTVRFYHVTVNGPGASYHHLNSVNAEYVHVNYVNTTAVELQRTPVRMEHFSSANTEIGFSFFPEHTDLHRPVRIKNLQPARTASVMVKRNNRSAMVVVDSDLDLDALTTTGHAPIRFEFSLQDTAFNAQTKAVIPGVRFTYLDGQCTATVSGPGDTISNVVSAVGCPLVFGHFIIGDQVWVCDPADMDAGEIRTVAQVTDASLQLDQPCSLQGVVEVYRCQERTTDAQGLAEPVHLPYAALFSTTHRFHPCWKRVKHGAYQRWLRIPVAAGSKDVVELYADMENIPTDPEVMTADSLPGDTAHLEVGQLLWHTAEDQMYRLGDDGWDIVPSETSTVSFRAGPGAPTSEDGDAAGHYAWDTVGTVMYVHDGAEWQPVGPEEDTCPVRVGAGPPDEKDGGTLYLDENSHLLYSRPDDTSPWSRLTPSAEGAAVVRSEPRDPLPSDVQDTDQSLKTWWHNTETRKLFVLFAAPGSPDEKMWLAWQNSCPSTIYKRFRPSMADGTGLPEGTLWVDLHRRCKYVWAPNEFGQLDWQLDVTNPALVVVDTLPPAVDFQSGSVVYARESQSLFLHDGTGWKPMLPTGTQAPDPDTDPNPDTDTESVASESTEASNGGTADPLAFVDPLTNDVPAAVFSMDNYTFQASPDLNTLEQLHALLRHTLAVDGTLQVSFTPVSEMPAFVDARRRMFYIYKVHLNNDYFALSAKQQNILVRWFILEEQDIARLITAEKRQSFVTYVQQAVDSTT